MDEARPRAAAYVQIVLGTMLLGAVFAVSKLMAPLLPPFTNTVMRYGGAALFLVPFAWREARAVKAADWPALLFVGLCGGFLFNAFLFWGLRFTPASDSVLAPATMPLMTAAASAVLLGDRPTRAKLLFMGLSVLGLAVVFSGNLGSGGPPRLAGDGLHLLAAVSYATFVFGTARFAGRFGSVLISAVMSGASGLLALPIALYEGGLPRVAAMPLAGWLGAAYLAIGATVFGVVLWNRGVQALGASAAGLFMNFIPIWGLLTAMGLLHERLTALQGVGILVVLAGVFGASRAGNQPRAAAAPPREAVPTR